MMSAALVLLSTMPLPLPAEETQDDGVVAWRELDTALRQAVIDEVVARRGLAKNVDNADELIRTTEDISEALQISCDLTSACTDEQLKTLPDYDEQQGLRNAEIIMNMKRGYEK